MPYIPILSQINTMYPLPSHLLKISYNIILPYMCVGLPGVLFPSGYPTKPLYGSLLSPIHNMCLAHLICNFALIGIYILLTSHYRMVFKCSHVEVLMVKDVLLDTIRKAEGSWNMQKYVTSSVY
jgi:hypothetical protein